MIIAPVIDSNRKNTALRSRRDTGAAIVSNAQIYRRTDGKPADGGDISLS